jgi:signal transduction histidine kinase
VEDNGVGIREQDIEKLFRIDAKVYSKGTAEESGTGLGLILCKEFVEKNSGTIRVESKPGKGSQFIFTLPSYSV